METRPRILVLSPSNLATDPRVNRQLRLLRGMSRLTAAGFADPEMNEVEFVSLPSEKRGAARRARCLSRLLVRGFSSYYDELRFVREARRALRGRTFDLVVANDAESLPIALEFCGSDGRVLFDAHEYAPREFDDRLYWRALYRPYKTWICRKFLPRAHGITTVCDGIADEYARVFGVSRPAVVPNAPARHPGSPCPTVPNRIRLIHHGLASSSRKLEMMIDLVSHLDRRFTLDLMLVSPESGYLERLRRRAAGNPRVQFRDPVRSSQIIAATSNYDIGLFLLPPTNFNYRFALPNKFFEFVQARLAIAIGPSPEMADLVRRHQLGVVAKDFAPATLARQLNALDAPTIDQAKLAAHRAADILCWENAQGTMITMVKKLLTKRCAA